MYALIAMVSSLVLLVVLLRLKIRLGLSMLLAALFLALLLGVGPAQVYRTLEAEWRDKSLSRTTGFVFITLSALVTLVNVLGVAMKEAGVSGRLASALEGTFKSRRAALAAIPMLMGLLPTPGGIMLSAPMVRDLGDRIGMERAHAAAVNFFFRHQWETVWPLFPAVLWIQGMLDVPAVKLISHNAAIMLCGILGGIVFLLLRGIPRKDPGTVVRGGLGEHARDLCGCFWPIALVAGLYAVFDLPPAAGLVPAIAVFLLIHRVPPGRWAVVFRSGFRFDVVVLIFGALLFKLNLEAARAVQSAVEFLRASRVPPALLVFCLPMLVGALTGLTLGTVAITFPIILPFIGTGQQARLGIEVLAFAGLVCGLLLTPVHLCMALSVTYFDAPLSKIIARLLGPVAFVAAAGVLMAVLFG